MAPKLFDIAGFVTELAAIEHDMHELGPKIVERACKIVAAKARSAIGREHEEWAPLSPATIADKAHHGFPTPKPLLRTGELRDSIEWQTNGLEGCVGSDSPIALYQELGTSRIPPRSFLVSSAISSEDKINRMAGAATVAILSGHGRHASEIGELLHRLREAGHEIKEQIEDLFEHDSDEGRHK